MKGILVTMVMSMFLLSYVSPLTSVLHHEIGLVQLGFIENCSYCVSECSLTSQPWLPTDVVTILKIDIDDITQTFNFLFKVKAVKILQSSNQHRLLNT